MTDDASDSPEVLEAIWSREQIESLFADLKSGAKVRHVQVRTRSGTSHATRDTVASLQQAYQMWSDGLATAIQIYYEFDDQGWCDTLIVQDDTCRIVRTRLPANFWNRGE